MTRRRRVGAALIGVALSAPLVVLGAGTAAASSTTVDPAGVTGHGETTITAVIDERLGERTGVAELRLSGPGVAPTAVAKARQPSPEEPRNDPAAVTFAFTTAPCNVPGCAEGAVAPNGTWTARLFEVDRPQAEEVERGEPARFLVDVPAGQPQDVVAVLEGRTVTVSWARAGGPDKNLLEPDVRWSVDDGRGRAAAVGPEACSDGTCRAQVVYPADSSGPRTFTVLATRPCEGCSAAPVASSPSGEVVVPPAPVGAAGSAAPGTPGASPTPGGGEGRATAQSFGQGFRPGPGLGLPALPALPDGPAPSVAGPQVADDTFGPTLGYDDRVETEREPLAASGGRDSVLSSTGGVLDEQLVRSVAGALVLLLSAAHLRSWLGRSPTG